MSSEIHENETEDRDLESSESTEGSVKRQKIENDVNELIRKTSKERKEKDNNKEEEEEGSLCTICFENWTNSGEHRISSLKCGHFFGLKCVEKWLKSGGSSCPNCNEKASRKDVRFHYTARLKAIDTSERDRALSELETFKIKYRVLELERETYKVNNQLMQDEIAKLETEIKQLRSSDAIEFGTTNKIISNIPTSSTSSHKWMYHKRIELLKDFKGGGGARILTFDVVSAMLIISLPSTTVLAPGFGVKRINLLDLSSPSFVALHKDTIRDLAFNPTNHVQLLSVSQDKTIKLTNISSCSEIVKYVCESEVWSCAWNTDEPHEFFVGTKRSQILHYDTRLLDSTPKTVLEFPVLERRPIIALAYVPLSLSHSEFPIGGLLALTLGSLWFFKNSGGIFKPYKLPIEGLFWSLKFEAESRMILVSTKPSPHARHIVASLRLLRSPSDDSENLITASVIMDHSRGGTYTEKSFLRSTLFTFHERILVAYSRGSCASDHKVVVQEVGSDIILQELPIRRPIIDISDCRINESHYLFLLSETEVFIYKWI